MQNNFKVLSWFFALFLAAFLGFALWSAAGVRAQINKCEDNGGVWHQESCMKAEYFMELDKKK